jgi:hypothetical protein
MTYSTGTILKIKTIDTHTPINEELAASTCMNIFTINT